jgi:hypothetical protein
MIYGWVRECTGASGKRRDGRENAGLREEGRGKKSNITMHLLAHTLTYKPHYGHSACLLKHVRPPGGVSSIVLREDYVV